MDTLSKSRTIPKHSRYTLQRASEPLHLSLKALVNYRDHHHRTTSGEWRMQIEPVPHGVCITAFSGAALSAIA